MKTSRIIRFVLAAVFATLACAGLLAHVIGSAVLFSVPWLLLMGRAELTKPIPRNEWWWTIALIVIFLAVVLTLPFLHLPVTHDAVTHGLSHPVVVAALWIFWMWAIYRRWQNENGKADA
jgi:hypothetical protein